MDEEYKTETVRVYNEHPEHFAKRFAAAATFETRPEFARFLQEIHGTRVLDMGCGSGDHALYFNRRGLETVGIDLAENLVAISRERGVDAHVMDFEHLDFAPDTFDGVWCCAAIVHTPRQRVGTVLEGVQRVLKPDGVLFVKVKRGEGERFVVDNSGTRRYFSFWSEDELVAILARRFSIVHTFSNTDTNGDWISIFCRNDTLKNASGGK